MVVLEALDKTVSEWSEENQYQLTENYANSKLGTKESEYAVRCVYVSDIRSEPSKDYTFGESRVALIDAHHADGGRRMADRVRADVLADVFQTLRAEDMNTAVDLLAATLVADGYDADLTDEALELADVALTIGAEGDDA